jgi:enoyl-CoA hydratase
MNNYVTVEKYERIAVVRFDRSDSANTLSFPLMRELTEVANTLAEDANLCAVVLTGRSDNFCLGMDLKDPEVIKSATANLSERRLALKTGPHLCNAWEKLEALTIVAIEGWCAGGGAALAVSCDLRVIAEDSHFYVPEVERGFNMSWGSVPRITNLVGPAKAKRLIVLAEKISADSAIDWGVGDYIAPKGDTVEVAIQLASRAANLPPNSVHICKSAINSHAHALNTATSHGDMDQFALVQNSEDCAEGINAFLEKRDPIYSGN